MKYSRTTYIFFKWLSYTFLLFFLCILQQTPGFLSIFGVRPLLVLPFVICLSMFENIQTAAVIGCIGGAFWDAMGQKCFGFSSVLLCICAVLTSLLILYFIKCTVLNSLLMCTGAFIIYQFFDIVFTYWIWGFSHIFFYVLHRVLPMLIWTIIITLPLFFAARKLYTRFADVIG